MHSETKVKSLQLYALIGFISFVFIYILGNVKSVFNNFVYLPPFGLIGQLISLALLIPFLSINRGVRQNVRLISLFIFYLTIALLAASSEYFETIDIWLFTKMFVSAPLIGYFLLIYINQNNDNKTVSIVLFIAIILLTVSISFFYFNRSLFLDLNYLNLSEGTIITSLLLLTILKKNWQKYLLIILTIVLLFMSDSRFVFISYILVIMIYVAFTSLKQFILLISLAILVFTFFLFSTPEIILESRLLRLLINTNSDTSLNARSALVDSGFLNSNLYSFVGKHGYYRLNCDGCYTHNILSLWFEFGLVGFLFGFFLIFFTLSGWFTALKTFIKKSIHSSYHTFYILIATHSLVGFILSKNWQYFTFFFVIGMTFFIFDKQASSRINSN